MGDLVECQPCREWMPAEDILNHFRLLHPDIDANPDNIPTTDLTNPAAAMTSQHPTARP